MSVCPQGHDSIDVPQQTVSLSGPDGITSIKYDLLVGADGVRSEVRKVLVKSDRSMKSEYGFVGPMRYVTATKLGVPLTWPSPEWQQVMQPPREPDIQQDPNNQMASQGEPLQSANIVSSGLTGVNLNPLFGALVTNTCKPYIDTFDLMSFMGPSGPL